jgi:hypothetical protein
MEESSSLYSTLTILLLSASIIAIIIGGNALTKTLNNEEVSEVIDNLNSIPWKSLNPAMEKINSLDIPSINSAITKADDIATSLDKNTIKRAETILTEIHDELNVSQINSAVDNADKLIATIDNETIKTATEDLQTFNALDFDSLSSTMTTFADTSEKLTDTTLDGITKTLNNLCGGLPILLTKGQLTTVSTPIGDWPIPSEKTTLYVKLPGCSQSTENFCPIRRRR